MVLSSNPVAVTSPSHFAPASNKKFLDIQATIECGFTLKCVRDMTRKYSYNDKLVIIELPFPDFITTLCIMKTISPEKDRSFVVNPEFRDNPEKWYVWNLAFHLV